MKTEQTKYYTTINAEFVQDEIHYGLRTQLEYVRSEIALTTYDDCKNPCDELHFVSLDCDGNEVYIPAKFSAVIDECIDVSEKNINELITDNKDSGIKDYFKFAKEALDIDMKVNYKPQYNKVFYDRIDLIVPGSSIRRKETNGFDQE